MADSVTDLQQLGSSVIDSSVVDSVVDSVVNSEVDPVVDLVVDSVVDVVPAVTSQSSELYFILSKVMTPQLNQRDISLIL